MAGLKTAKTAKTTLSLQDKRFNLAICEVATLTNEYYTAIRQEPEYGIYLIAECDSFQPDTVKYRVTDHWEESRNGNSMRFQSFTEANNFYSGVVAAGSWSIYKKEVAQVAALEPADLYAYGTKIRRKSDNKELGYIAHRIFVQSEYCKQINVNRHRDIVAAVKKYIEVK